MYRNKCNQKRISVCNDEDSFDRRRQKERGRIYAAPFQKHTLSQCCTGRGLESNETLQQNDFNLLSMYLPMKMEAYAR
jgi:hypothetical protein